MSDINDHSSEFDAAKKNPKKTNRRKRGKSIPTLTKEL
jgi:hypothetical protein